MFPSDLQFYDISSHKSAFVIVWVLTELQRNNNTQNVSFSIKIKTLLYSFSKKINAVGPKQSIILDFYGYNSPAKVAL